MKLPGFERAVIEPAKLRDYLLSREHPVGRFKAAFFGTLGYSLEGWRRLEADLRTLIASHDAMPGEPSEHGPKYQVRGTLKAPTGATAEIVSIWIILTGEDFPRFVTAYPGAGHEI